MMTIQDANKLFLEGTIAFGFAERNGIRVDVPLLNATLKEQEDKAKKVLEAVGASTFGQKWKEHYKDKTSYISGQQLKHMVKTVYNIDVDKADKKMLKDLGIGEASMLLSLRKEGKRFNELKQIKKEVTEDGRLHPFFNLNGVSSFRSSSSNINFQNLSVRDSEAGSLIRSLFIPSAGNRIIEVDMAAAEVRTSCWVHKDPTLIKYLIDDYDMHSDVACQLFKLKKEEMEKKIRYYGKNGFVFPSFYGSYWAQIAPILWDVVTKENLTCKDGVPLKDKVFQRIGQTKEIFSEHVKAVEFDFWNNRFSVYNAWKKSAWDNYQKTGEFHSLTGFPFKGLYTRNQVTNFPVQSVAFHSLLWSFIQITKEFLKNKWKSKLVGQIHDSMVFDAHPDEFDKVLQLCKKTMTQDLPASWSFVNTPIVIEAEATEVDESWFKKKGVKI